MSAWIGVDPTGEDDFDQARRQATFRTIIGILNRRGDDLLQLEAVRARVNVRGQHYRGVQSIAVDHIVGSEGRVPDFDRHFMPLTYHTKERWKSIQRAYTQGRTLPPIDVYKLGDIYFVRDGNHRVSVARQLGQTEIEAHVTELTTDVVLHPELTTRDLSYIEEQSDFLEWTGLVQARGSISIEVSQLGGYLDLIRHINRHRAQLSAARGQSVEREEAAAHWYDAIYLPVVKRLREAGLLQHSDGKTEADLFLAVLKQQESLALQGRDHALEQVTEAFISEMSRPSLRQWVMAMHSLWPA